MRVDPLAPAARGWLSILLFSCKLRLREYVHVHTAQSIRVQYTAFVNSLRLFRDHAPAMSDSPDDKSLAVFKKSGDQQSVLSFWSELKVPQVPR